MRAPVEAGSVTGSEVIANVPVAHARRGWSLPRSRGAPANALMNVFDAVATGCSADPQATELCVPELSRITQAPAAVLPADGATNTAL
eukprot:SAG31_NODE_13508_length_864_cov_1.479739_1_plen_88_part_00